RVVKRLGLYDGDCSFCRRWVLRWQALTSDRIEYEPFQQAGERFVQISREKLAEAIHLVEPNGSVTRGAHAVFRALELGGKRRWLAFSYENFPGFAAASEAVYGLVARHRSAADKLDLWLI